MFTSVRNFVKRNRANIAIGVGLAGAAFVYARSKFSEARDRMASERMARENLKRRFEQNQEDCSLTVLALLPTAVEQIMEDMPVEKLTHELQQKKADRLSRIAAQSHEAGSQDGSFSAIAPRDDDTQSVQSFATESHVLVNVMSMEEEKPRRTRAQLWNEIKINSITRAFTLIYTLALLIILTRVQLNVLGRKNYLSSVVSLAERDDQPTIHLENNSSSRVDERTSTMDDETSRQYLTFSWWFLNKGWRRIKDRVEGAVKQVFGPYTPRDSITMQNLDELTSQIRRIVEQDTTSWLPYLMPAREEESTIFSEAHLGPPESYNPLTWPASQLRKMLDETSDFLDSPAATVVVKRMLDAAFALLVDQKLSEGAFKSSGSAPVTPSASTLSLPLPLTKSKTPTITEGSSEGESGTESGRTMMTKVASVLAVLTRQAHLIGSGNEYFQVMEQQKELEAFSAVVYLHFDNLGQMGDNGSLSS